MSTIGQNNSKAYVGDIEGFPSPGQLFASSRPDLVMVSGDVYYVFELTVCFETNLIKSNEYKTKKYDDLCREVINKQVKLELFFIEISCVGFTSSNLKPFSNLIKSWGISVNQLVSKSTEVACKATYYIFNRRGKSWNVNDML